MKKIGEVSKLFNISNRMLRYYEQKGIIKTTRQENNYRYYDEYSIQKIKQILSLKQLGFTVREIEKVFSSNSTIELIQLLQNKKSLLIKQQKELTTLTNVITNFIHLLNTSNESIFQALSLSLRTPPEILKGAKKVNNENLRIITLPSMRVVSFLTVSETPEDDTWNKVNEFIKDNNLTDFRHFGFNNPSPKEGNPVYGYEMWVTVPKDFKTLNVTKEISGGLYASLTSYLTNIGEKWNELSVLINDSESYEFDFDQETHPWLEECTNYTHFIDPNIHFSEKQLDLLLPIKRK